MAESTTAQVILRLPAGEIEVELAVPSGLARVEQLLPLANALTERIIDLTVTQLETEGRKISCRAGCGACCRQLVPIAAAEARRIRDLVASFPEPRRSVVLARFADAFRRFEDAGLLAPLRERADWDNARRLEIGVAYFRQGIACPFLENESCTIHPDRPIMCREYLVTSPPERCADPRADQVEGVKLPASVWTAVVRLEPAEPGAKSIPWVPLILALDWAESHSDEPAAQSAADLVRRLFENITRKTAVPEADESCGSSPSIDP